MSVRGQRLMNNNEHNNEEREGEERRREGDVAYKKYYQYIYMV